MSGIKFKDLTTFQRKWIAELIQSNVLKVDSASSTWSSAGGSIKTEIDLIENHTTYPVSSGVPFEGTHKCNNDELIVIPYDRAYERDYDE